MKQLVLMLLLAVCATAQTESKADHDMANCPMHAQHTKSDEKHLEGVQKRGEAHEGMGFSQTKTTHHFFLTQNGGIIQVTANDSADPESITQIQSHIGHIAKMFANGDFSIPHFVHDQNPPGVGTMKELRGQISYEPVNTKNGAKLLIQTRSSAAREAVHEFLRFQIKDHRTGDPLTITAGK